MIPFLILGSALACQVLDPEELASENLRELDRILLELNELSQKVTQGELPDLQELALARTSRHQVLRRFNPRSVGSLAYTPEQLRARLMPGFASELRLLSDLSSGSDPLPETSPLLVQMLDLEEEIAQEAYKQLYRMGLQNPLEVGSLAAATPDPMEVSTLTPDTAPQASTEEPEVDLAAGMDPLLRAEALFAAGKYEEALVEYRTLALERDQDNLPTIYRIAECLLKSGRAAEARDEFRAISRDFKDTTYGQNAEWSADYAEVLAALNSGESR